MENRELDEKLKQDDSESDQSEKSKITNSSPTSVTGRRESSSSRTVDSKKEDKPIIIEETKSEDIEEVNYKDMLNRFCISKIYNFGIVLYVLNLNFF